MKSNNNINHNQKVGQFGEKLAKKYLENKGYAIIGENIQVGRQEIDILAKIRDLYVFFEVKTRIYNKYSSAEDSMNHPKTTNIKKGIEKYIDKEKMDINRVRADLIAIEIDKNKKSANIKHYRDII